MPFWPSSPGSAAAGSRRNLAALMSRDVPPDRVELVEERLEISKRDVERGRLVVRTRTEERDEFAEIELQQEEVTVDRVARGVPIDVVPSVHEEDGVLIIPVVEEQLVVTKRLILKEEIRITRRARRELVRKPVRLRSELAAVERQGCPIPSPRKGTPSMTDRTLTAMYDTSGAAESARDQLVGIGVAREAISIHGTEGEAIGSSPTTEPTGFWASLADLFMPDEDRHTYSEGLRRGSYLLSARVSDELEAAAADILEGSEPIDLDHRRANWRQEGWAGYQALPRRAPPMAKEAAWPKLAPPSVPTAHLPALGQGMARLLRARPWKAGTGSPALATTR